jgi:hypothetical protein
VFHEYSVPPLFADAIVRLADHVRAILPVTSLSILTGGLQQRQELRLHHGGWMVAGDWPFRQIRVRH